MTESNERLELSDRYREILDDETVEWFQSSDLPGDERTRAVVEHLEHAHGLDPLALEPDIHTAIVAAHFHRAPEIGRDADGEAIESFEDVPGEFHEIELEALKGSQSQSALQEHCTSTESRAAAAMLNMAVRWADGEEGYKWAKRTLNRVYSTGEGQPIAPTEELSTLERAEREIVGS
jgi:hypothetical protein